MEMNIVLKTGMQEMSVAECRQTSGGGDIRNFVRCFVGAMTTGGGAYRTAILGAGLFGMARAAGVAVGCANL